MGVLATTTSATITSVLGNVGEVAEKVLEYVGDVAQVAVTEPLFAIPLGVFILGAGVGIMSRILHK